MRSSRKIWEKKLKQFSIFYKIENFDHVDTVFDTSENLQVIGSIT